MRERIEPITGCNVANLGDEELGKQLKFYATRLDMGLGPEEHRIAQEVLSVLRDEDTWRADLKKVGCPWLLDTGNCRHVKVADKHGEHRCPRLSGSGCTLKRMELAAKFSKSPA